MTQRHRLIHYVRVGRGAETRASKRPATVPSASPPRIGVSRAFRSPPPRHARHMHASFGAPLRHFYIQKDINNARPYIRNHCTTQPAADRVTWYENTDGEGTFALGLDLSTTADGAQALAIADIDGDQDLDVVSASLSASGVQWFENTNSKGAFSLANSLEPANPANGAM